jgi:pSer/pThr/pTyr-binding forkhead associated (FHA) protein
MARLLFDCEGVDVITHELIGDVITIGRAPSNDVVIDDPTVSAQHASLTKSPSGYRLRDLGSTNEGSEIRFGYVTGVFQDATASIGRGEELQAPDEHDRLAQIRVPGTQPMFRPRAR